MQIKYEKLKEKMLEYTGLFSVEKNSFQKFVIIYNYISLLKSNPLSEKILNKELNKIIDNIKNENDKNNIISSNDLWVYLSYLEVIYGNMKLYKEYGIKNKKKIDYLSNLFSKPYSNNILKLSFEIINNNIFDKLDQIYFLNVDKISGKTLFNEKNSILFIKGFKIIINKQDKITNAHKILKYILLNNKDNLNDDFFYSEIAYDEFGDTEYKLDKNAWQKYYTACIKIQEKIRKQTKTKIDDFLIFNTGRTGKIKINKRYI